MKAKIKYVEQEFTIPEIVDGKRVDVTEIVKVPHAIVDGEDKGEIINIHSNDYDETEEIHIEFFNVCPDCLDEFVDVNCMCYHNKYKPIKVIKAICGCCGHPY